MSSLWNALDEIDRFYGPDEDAAPAHRRAYVRIMIPGAVPESVERTGEPIPARQSDDLEDAPSNVYPTEKAREALHGDPIRAHERHMALVAAGDPHAVAIAEACRRWLAARESTSTIELQKGA